MQLDLYEPPMSQVSDTAIAALCMMIVYVKLFNELATSQTEIVPSLMCSIMVAHQISA